MKPRMALATLVFVSVVASACTGGADMTGSRSTQVKAWVTGSGMDALDARLSADGSAIQAAVSANNRDQLTAACTTLVSDIAQANSYLPTPDQQLTNDLSLAYAHYYDAGRGCLDQKASIASGAFSHDLALVTQAKQAVIKAQAEVISVTNG